MYRMKNNLSPYHKLFLVILLGVITISFFLIKGDKNGNAEITVTQQTLSINIPSNEKLVQTTPKLFKKNSGKILSIESGGGYSFLKVELPSHKLLPLASANLPKNTVIGSDIHWENPRLAKNYFSHALKKTFDKVYMVTIKDNLIESGVVKSLNTVDGIIFVTVQQEQLVKELRIKSERVFGKLMIGAKVEWQLEKNELSSNQPMQYKSFAKPNVMIDWIRIQAI